MTVPVSVKMSDLSRSGRADAEYHASDLLSVERSWLTEGGVRIGDLVSDVSRGVSPPYSSAGTVPVVRTVNVRSVGFSAVRQSYVEPSALASFPRAQIRKRDVVVTSTGVGTLGRVFCNLDGKVRFADGHLTILKPLPEVDEVVLTALLQSAESRAQFVRRQRGSSGQVEIYPDDLRDVVVPKLTPDFEGQLREIWMGAVEDHAMSNRLYPEAEALLLERLKRPKPGAVSKWRVASFSEVRSKARADAEHFAPSLQWYADKLKAAEADELGGVLAESRKGVQPAGYDANGMVRVVKSKDVQGWGVDLAGCQKTSDQTICSDADILKDGDVLFNTTGMGTIGRASRVITDATPTVASVDVAVLKCGPDLDPGYLSVFLNSPFGLAQTMMWQVGSSGQMHLYPRQLARFLIYIPRDAAGRADLKWQGEISDKLKSASDRRASAILKMEAAQSALTAHLRNRASAAH